ncbi:uncharacterized mitochondrial protein AtMg00810-like [Humulus lupulus]|uniref:uncharacterized mitochondrial protein AtMg00810-like n=1 Tax=Humulus lupulus TaxID=3486 RepID=UPI002B4152D1|nr:uncharacterized mitochondrial protein AtMg00810-like [Humulus lupulus]
MKDEFEMSMVGELNYFLGLQVKQTEDGTFISQSKYAKNLIKKFGMESTKHAKTPMETMVKLTKDENGVKVDPTLATRPDISYNVGVCAPYQGNPMKSHVTAVKRIIHYVNVFSLCLAAMVKTRGSGSRSLKDLKAGSLTTSSSLTKKKA